VTSLVNIIIQTSLWVLTAHLDQLLSYCASST